MQRLQKDKTILSLDLSPSPAGAGWVNFQRQTTDTIRTIWLVGFVVCKQGETLVLFLLHNEMQYVGREAVGHLDYSSYNKLYETKDNYF